MPSTTIHSLIVPRALRVDLAVGPAHSGADVTEVETLCQNSDVAICVTQTSKLQNVGEVVEGISRKNHAMKRNKKAKKCVEERRI